MSFDSESPVDSLGIGTVYPAVLTLKNYGSVRASDVRFFASECACMAFEDGVAAHVAADVRGSLFKPKALSDVDPGESKSSRVWFRMPPETMSDRLRILVRYRGPEQQQSGVKAPERSLRSIHSSFDGNSSHLESLVSGADVKGK